MSKGISPKCVKCSVWAYFCVLNNIVLNSEDVIAEIVERAKESKKRGVVAGGKARHSAQGSTEPKAEIPTNTNEEIGKLAGVSKLVHMSTKKEQPKLL